MVGGCDKWLVKMELGREWQVDFGRFEWEETEAKVYQWQKLLNDEILSPNILELLLNILMY